MIAINIVCVGNLKEKFWVDAQNEYIKRLSRFCKLKVIEVEEQNFLSNPSQIIEREGEEILEKQKGSTFVFDIHGSELTSQEFAKLVSSQSLTSSTITFVVGGSYGVSEKVKQSATKLVSFGKITLPHNLARIVALEQIYRAFNIISGTNYHK